ncbi:MAG TPA: hypothetical protein DIW81_15440 [Planctomycetaceae bacterium]|nr:hypothetical protein [Rubinisphaera sp.]HCS52963.1 hypothetical protein [Planctomycetaceae bacterium]
MLCRIRVQHSLITSKIGKFSNQRQCDRPQLLSSEKNFEMASKYINIEDAAKRLSISVEELNRKRERGEIRAFSDRGTWKFRGEDVEELARNIEPDSGFDIPSSDIMKDDDIAPGAGSQIVLEEEMGDLPTVISKNPPNEPPSSDSDVRLVVDPSLESDDWSSSDSSFAKSGKGNKSSDSADEVNDSDVRFVDASMSDVTPTPIRITEESDVINVDESDDRWSGISDSDVRLAASSDIDESDSDVVLDDSGLSGSDVSLEAEEELKLAGEDDDVTDPDMKSLGESDSDVTLVGVGEEEDDDDYRLSSIDGDLNMDPGSDITLMPPGDSNVRLDEANDDDDSILSDVMSDPASGLSFSSGDSGISLDLALDSGISLDSDDDDDSLTLGADSGISLVPDMGSGLTLADDEDDSRGESTIPMMGTIGDDDDDTSFDMPLLEDSNPELSTDDEATNVVMFDDDDTGDTMEFDSSELSNEDEFVDFDDDDSFDELSDGELDVSDDLLDDDVLDASDDAFEDDFESGESIPALAVPGAMRGGAGVAAAAEWDMFSFALVLVSTIMMGICTLLMFDLVRSMWGFAEPNGVNGMILETLQGFIK